MASSDLARPNAQIPGLALSPEEEENRLAIDDSSVL